MLTIVLKNRWDSNFYYFIKLLFFIIFILTSTVTSIIYSTDNKYCRYIFLVIEGAMALKFSFTTPSYDDEKSCSCFIVTDQAKTDRRTREENPEKKSEKILKQENRIGETAE